MIFIASIEVRPLSKSKMNTHGIGALVYCFIPADSKKAAQAKLQQALSEDNYSLINIEFLQNYNGYNWENEEDQVEYDKLAHEAASIKDVVYGPFYTWSHDDH